MPLGGTGGLCCSDVLRTLGNSCTNKDPAGREGQVVMCEEVTKLLESGVN